MILVMGSVAYNLFDDGLGNVLALETLRHGTNPINYMGIYLFGGDPSHGGKKTGATYKKLKDNTISYFYLVKDSDYIVNEYNSLIPPSIAKRALPLIFSTLSGYNLATIYLDRPCFESGILKKIRIVIGGFGGILSTLITPTIKFRFSYIDHDRFQDDPVAELWAFRTAKKIEAWRIGFSGSLFTGINKEWWQRVKSHPYKVLVGTAQISCALVLIAKMFSDG